MADKPIGYLGFNRRNCDHLCYWCIRCYEHYSIARRSYWSNNTWPIFEDHLQKFRLKCRQGCGNIHNPDEPEEFLNSELVETLVPELFDEPEED